MSLTGMGTEAEREARMMKKKRGSLGRRVRRKRRRRRGDDSRTERGGLHSVCGEGSFLNASFIQEHFVCIRALVQCSYCGGLSRGTVRAGDTVVIHFSHIYPLAGALNKNSLTKWI